MESQLAGNLQSTGFLPASGGLIDFLSRDGKTAIEVQRTPNGRRGLYSAVVQMGLFLERNPAVERGCIVRARTQRR